MMIISLTEKYNNARKLNHHKTDFLVIILNAIFLA